jgi:hypothetical protein
MADVQPALQSEFLFEMRLPQKAEMILDMGQTPLSRLVYSVAETGSIVGPKIKGEVVNLSGGDWTRIRADMSIALDVRLVLKTDDGALIYMTYQGLMVAKDQADFLYMIDARKPDDPEGAKTRFYYRIICSFETGDQRYAWLNHQYAVGSGRLGDEQAIYEIFSIL